MRPLLKRPAALLLGLLMVGVLVVVLYPFLWLVLSSLKTEKEIIQYPPRLWPRLFTWEQYARVWNKLPIFSMVKNTLLFSLSVTFFNCALSAGAGYAFARLRFPWREGIFMFVLLTMMVPFQIIMIPLYILEFNLGILDSYAGLILPRITWPFGVYLMRAFFVSLPKNLEEAARMDGAGEYRVLGAVMLPLCKPALLTVGIMTFVNNWNDLIYPLLLTNRTEMRTLSAGLAMFIGQRIIEYGATLSASVIALAPLVAIYIALQKYFVEGIALSGLK
jgi:multiple sugar transport system permease protein